MLDAPLTRTPRTLSRSTPGQGHSCPQQQQPSVVQGWPFPGFPWQIRPLERGCGQGCPSALVFVPQLGLISPVLTVVHWFPLHVPRGLQTPPRSSSGLPPESLCLWILVILLPPPFLPSSFPMVFGPPGSFRQHCPGPAQRADPDQGTPGMHQQHPPTHHFTPACSQTAPDLSAEPPLPPGQDFSPTSMSPTAPLPFPPDPNRSSLFAAYLQQSHHLCRDFPCRCGAGP